MDWQKMEIYILILWSFSVSAQNGYEYLKPQEPLLSNNPLESKGLEYFHTTEANLPIQDYTRGNIPLTTPSSLRMNISSTSSSLAKFRSDDTTQQKKTIYSFPGQGNVPTSYQTGRPSSQGFDQSIAPRRLFAGIDNPQLSIPAVPQYNNQIDTQYQGVSSFPQYPETIGSQRYPDVTSIEQEAVVEGDYSAIPGSPGIDYPLYAEIPLTSFRCEEQQYPGYYADVETQCQVFHVCANNRTYDFLCPNGTIFHQEYLVCVWWNTFDCNLALTLYDTNAKIYEYSLKRAQNFFDNIQSIRYGQGTELSNISQPLFSSGPEREILGDSRKPSLLNQFNQRTDQPGTSRFQYTVPSNLQGRDRGGEETLSSVEVTQSPSYTKKFSQPSDYSTEVNQYYGYPREVDYESRFVATGISGQSPRLQIHDSSKVARYPSGIPRGPADLSYGSGTLKSPDYHTARTQRPGSFTESDQLPDISKSGPSNTAEQFPGQQPIREYLPPVQK